MLTETKIGKLAKNLETAQKLSGIRTLTMEEILTALETAETAVKGIMKGLRKSVIFEYNPHKNIVGHEVGVVIRAVFTKAGTVRKVTVTYEYPRSSHYHSCLTVKFTDLHKFITGELGRDLYTRPTILRCNGFSPSGRMWLQEQGV